jgi:phosphatidylglycerophosphate synthase
MSLADQLTLARAAAVPLVVVLFVWDFPNHKESMAYWALWIALILTWLSGLDYARVAPGLLRGRPVAQ